MKKVSKIFFLILTVVCLLSGSQKAYAQNPGDNLTQYLLVDADGNGPKFRNTSKMATLLRKLGFKVTTYNAQYEGDEAVTTLTATRTAKNGGKTRVVVEEGEGSTITINFATQAEVNAFVDSMERSHYKKSGGIWRHPKTSPGFHLGAKVNGKQVKILSDSDPIVEIW